MTGQQNRNVKLCFDISTIFKINPKIFKPEQQQLMVSSQRESFRVWTKKN
jgi:hypothetical protein